MQGSSRGGVPVSFLERISARERSETEFPVGADDEDDNFERERKRFLLLDFAGDAGDDDDSSASGSSSDLDSSDFEDDEVIESGAEGDADGGDQETENLDVEDQPSVNEDSEERLNHEDVFGREALPPEAVFAHAQPRDDDSLQGMAPPASPPPSWHHYQSLSMVLVRLANSEDEPLIRADIPWSLIVSCGKKKSVNSNPKDLQMPLVTNQVDSIPPDATLLRALYPSTDDPNGTRLFHGFLRMDPPLDAARALLEAFPLACLDMDGFFTASQFCHPKTSAGADESDVGEVSEVVRLVMEKTIQARRLNTIDWGMVAFLGDARISPSIAKLLLRQKPEALIDPRHGAFGVSPLERMASGFFIHGDSTAWVKKLLLALRVASYVKMKRAPNPSIEITLPAGFFANDDQQTTSFHPYHELIRLLINPDFQGYKFGKHGFVNTLKACSAADPDAFVRKDNDGNLPLHIALQSKCASVLGVKGERRLIRYLLNLRKSSSLVPEGDTRRRLPLRLCVENGWPVHDLIIDAALSQDTALRSVDLPPLLHQALDGPYSPRYQINGVRELVRQTMKIVAKHPSVLSRYLDSKGRHIIHVALRNRIPVYDVIAEALPHSLEARDFTQDGFYPFQIAAMSFVAETENRSRRVELEENDDEHEKEALETSILFELIRRDPLCITWNCSSSASELLASRPVRKRNLNDGFVSRCKSVTSSCELRNNSVST